MKNKFYSHLAALGLLLAAPVVLHAQPGALDPTFNTTGYVIDPVNSGDNVQKILLQPDQKVLVIGMSFDAGYTSRAIVFRYLPDGTRDPEFGTDGLFTFEMDNEANLYSAVLTPEGKIILVGSTTDYQTYRILLMRLNADGTLDDSFAGNGAVDQVVTPVATAGEDMAYDVALDADNNILVCGSSYDENYIRRPIVVRFTPGGELDTTFGVNGVATIPVAVGACGFRGIQVQPDGRIVATGYFGNTELWYVLLLVRFETDGTLDGSFGEEGVVKYNYGNVDDEGYDLVLTPDGSILVAGITVTQTYNYSALLMKFTSDGAVDGSFGTDGAVEEDLDNFDYAAEVALQADGSIIMAGTSGVGPPSTFDLAVWKYTGNGTRDDTFGVNGLAQPQIPGHSAMIYGMDIQSDGKILVGGQARVVDNNINHFFTARLQNDIASGITEGIAQAALQAFPNPAIAGGMVTLPLTSTIEQSAQLLLRSVDGKQLHAFTARQLAQSAQGLTLTLPSELAPGLYYLSLEQRGERVSAPILITQ